MKPLWISRPDDGEGEYGPVTLPELRMMIRAGLLLPGARVRDDDTPPRELDAWPELAAALAATALRDWRGSAAHRGLVKSGIRLGEAAFERVNQAGDTAAPSVMQVLAINRAHEPDRIIEMPPWWRQIWFLNLMRWLPIGLTGIGFWLTIGLKTGNFAGSAVHCLPITVVWGWYVWGLRPLRWNGSC